MEREFDCRGSVRAVGRHVQELGARPGALPLEGVAGRAPDDPHDGHVLRLFEFAVTVVLRLDGVGALAVHGNVEGVRPFARLHVPPGQAPRRFGVGVAAVLEERVRDFGAPAVVEGVPEQVAAEGVDAGLQDAGPLRLGPFQPGGRLLRLPVRADEEEHPPFVEQLLRLFVVREQPVQGLRPVAGQDDGEQARVDAPAGHGELHRQLRGGVGVDRLLELRVEPDLVRVHVVGVFGSRHALEEGGVGAARLRAGGAAVLRRPAAAVAGVEQREGDVARLEGREPREGAGLMPEPLVVGQAQQPRARRLRNLPVEDRVGEDPLARAEGARERFGLVVHREEGGDPPVRVRPEERPDALACGRNRLRRGRGGRRKERLRLAARPARRGGGGSGRGGPGGVLRGRFDEIRPREPVAALAAGLRPGLADQVEERAAFVAGEPLRPVRPVGPGAAPGRIEEGRIAEGVDEVCPAELRPELLQDEREAGGGRAVRAGVEEHLADGEERGILLRGPEEGDRRSGRRPSAQEPLGARP